MKKPKRQTSARPRAKSILRKTPRPRADAGLRAELERAIEEARQRNAELAIINSIQHALASKLDIQAIYDLVGDKIRDMFDAQVVDIITYDRAADLVHYRYAYEKGARQKITPRAPRGFSGHILKTREPLMFNQDVARRMQEYGSVVIAGGVPKSYVGVPLIIGDEARGMLALQNIDRENVFTDADLRLLQTLAASMSVALENARLFDEIQSRNREITETLEQQTATSEILRVIASSPTDIQPIMDVIAENAFKLCDGLFCSVYLSDGNLVYQVAQANFSPDALEESRRAYPRPLARDSSISSRAILDRAVINIPDVPNDPTLPQVTRQYARALGMRALLAVPMMREGDAIGSIHVGRRESGAFGEKQISLLQTFARQAVIAVENVRLFNETTRLLKETEQRAAELAIVNSIGQAFAAQLELDALIQLVGDKMRETFNAQIVYVALLDRATNLINFPYYNENGKPRVDPPLPFGHGLTSKIILTREPLLINQNVEQRRSELGVVRQGTPAKSYIGVPILVGSQAIGVISVQSTEQEDRFGEADVRLLSTIAAGVGIAIDKARLYESTQNQKQYFEGVVSNSPVAIVTVGLESKIVSWNPAAEVLFGYTRAETIGKELDDLVALTDEIRAEAAACSRKATRGELSSYITRRNRRDGSLVDVQMWAVPVMVGGERVGAIALYNDITELKHTEQALRQQKQYYEALLQNSPVAIVTVDLETRVSEWNPAAEVLFGYTRAEALGHSVDDLVAFDASIHAEAQDYSSQGFAGELFHAVTKRNRKDGSLVDVDLWGVPIIVNGQRVGIYAIYVDIDELVRARHAAESANQAKSAFLATMSHEIRTPMNAVIGMSNLLLGTNLNDEQREYADIIRNSGDALLTIINDILDFSKIEAGKMDFDNQPFDLRECVESALDLVTTRATEKGIDLAYVMEDGVPPAIIGDATRLRQVLLNLLSNAVKFTEKGEVVLEVKVEGGRMKDEKPNPSSLHFSVRDTGIGISPAQQARLFQSFSQADASTSRKYGGTGLGLAISKRLVELMRGTMWVESGGAGKGSTFHFTLDAPIAFDFVPPTRAFPIGEQPLLRGKRVLIVDDNATNRRILTRQLQLWGLVTQDTELPRQALEWLARGEAFDVAILDMQMPAMDGAQLAAEIRKQRDATQLPLILFSSLGRREANADDALFAAYLLKPLKPSALFDALANVLTPEKTVARPVPAESQLDPLMSARLPLRILLVEDNAVNQKLALRILSQMGYPADVAANGLEALAAVERQRYDVALMDVQMPEMDGLEATRQIVARWQRGARPRIIAMTANATQGDRETCLAAGMDDYLAKPIRVAELVAALARAGESNG